MFLCFFCSTNNNCPLLFNGYSQIIKDIIANEFQSFSRIRSFPLQFYYIPDIPGYRVGIKTVERDKFPIIFKDNSYPQIICIKSTKYNNLIFVCGLATSNVLNNYQDDDLILDPNLRARGTKTGFYGFEQLVPIKSLNDLSTYKK